MCRPLGLDSQTSWRFAGLRTTVGTQKFLEGQSGFTSALKLVFDGPWELRRVLHAAQSSDCTWGHTFFGFGEGFANSDKHNIYINHNIYTNRHKKCSHDNENYHVKYNENRNQK